MFNISKILKGVLLLGCISSTMFLSSCDVERNPLLSIDKNKESYILAPYEVKHVESEEVVKKAAEEQEIKDAKEDAEEAKARAEAQAEEDKKNKAKKDN